MAQLNIAVSCRSMLISTGFFRFCKGIEQFYYALLFMSEPYTQAGAQPWRSWLRLGFHLATRQPPPDAAPADRLLIDTRPGRNFEVIVSSSNRKVLDQLRGLLGELDRVRERLTAADDEGRLARIRAEPKIDAVLIAPMRQSLERNEIPAEGVDAFMHMINRGLLALCDGQIESIAVEKES
jgi:hypothetical protein